MWAEACEALARAERLQRQFFRPGERGTRPVWEPPVDIFEYGLELWIVAALPGVEPQEIEIAVERGVLRVAGVRQLPACVQGAAIHRLDIPHGRFERSIRLPEQAWELGRSTLVNGCLVLTLTHSR